MSARRPGKMQNLTVAPYIQKEGVDFLKTALTGENTRKASR
jgi:hypothetical protein